MLLYLRSFLEIGNDALFVLAVSYIFDDSSEGTSAMLLLKDKTGIFVEVATPRSFTASPLN